jgi:SAM-dependent methyltransferase
MLKEHFQLHAEIEETHWWFRARRRIMVLLANHIVPKSKDKIVVDVGCGTGANIAALSRDYACRGFDTSDEAIRLASKRYHDVQFIHSQYPGVSRISENGARLVLLMDVLEHIEDDHAFLSGILKTQKAGSYLMLMVPADMTLWSHQDINHGHFRRYSRNDILALADRLSVRIHLLSYFNFYLYPAVRIIRFFNRIMKRTWGDAGTDLRTPGPVLNKLLEGIFFTESQRLLNLLRRRRTSGFPMGVSLIAIFRKDP